MQHTANDEQAPILSSLPPRSASHAPRQSATARRHSRPTPQRRPTTRSAFSETKSDASTRWADRPDRGARGRERIGVRAATHRGAVTSRAGAIADMLEMKVALLVIAACLLAACSHSRTGALGKPRDTAPPRPEPKPADPPRRAFVDTLTVPGDQPVFVLRGADPRARAVGVFLPSRGVGASRNPRDPASRRWVSTWRSPARTSSSPRRVCRPARSSPSRTARTTSRSAAAARSGTRRSSGLDADHVRLVSSRGFVVLERAR